MRETKDPAPLEWAGLLTSQHSAPGAGGTLGLKGLCSKVWVKELDWRTTDFQLPTQYAHSFSPQRNIGSIVTPNVP